MKLRHGLMGLLFVPVVGCSDSETILSVNVNLSNSEINRRAELWQPIQVTLVQGGKTKQIEIAPQTRTEDLDTFDATGAAIVDDMMNVVKEKSPAIIPRFFQRVTLDSGWAGSATVTAEATGAYLVTEQVDGK